MINNIFFFLFSFLGSLTVCRAQETRLTSPATSLRGPTETPQLKWGGDLRIRGQNEQSGYDDERISQKLRLRVGLKAEIQKDLKAEIRLATAKTNSSTNQTLGDNKEPGGYRRFIGLDLGYVEWSPVSFLKMNLGRIPQSHDRPGGSQILLDSDLALEGLSLFIQQRVTDSWGFHSHWGSTWIRENYDTYYSEDQTDNMFNWGQLAADFNSEVLDLKLGAGFFNFTALRGLKFSDVSTGGTARGNTEEGTGIYKNNYIPRQYYSELSKSFAGLKVGLFYEVVDNGETKDPHRAIWQGLILSQGPWQAQIASAQVDSDAVPAVFTDSDFAGGTTDSKGEIYNFQWKFKKGMTLAATHYVNRKRALAESTPYERTHLDLSASF